MATQKRESRSERIERLRREEVRSTLAAYSLGALEPNEMAAVTDVLRRDPELRARLAQLEVAVDHLALAAPPAEPDAAVKTRLMERLRADQAVRSVLDAMSDAGGDGRRPAAQKGSPPYPPPIAAVPLPEAPPPSPQQTGPPRAKAAALTPQQAEVAPPATSASPRPAGGWQDRLERWFGLNGWTALAGIAAALVMALAFYTVLLTNQIQVYEEQAALAEQQRGSLERERAALQEYNDALRGQLTLDRERLALIAQPQRLAILAGTEQAPGASATFYARDARGVVVLTGLEALPDGQVYQIWLIPQNEAPVSAGLLTVAEQGPTVFSLDLPIQTFSALGITVEPAGGSPAPTGATVLLGTPGLNMAPNQP